MINRKIDSPQKLKDKLKQIRTQTGLSQNSLLKELGFDQQLFRSNISQYELGTREPPLKVLLAYARLAGVPIDVLVDDQLNLDHL